MTPVDALCVIQRLKGSAPNIGTEHIAFALGVSRGQLCKELKKLTLVVEGEPGACADYNTRTSLMRHLFLLDNSTDITIKHIMEDALLYGSNGNIASTRGRTPESAQIIGVSSDELASIQSELDFLDEEEVTVVTLQLLLKKKLPNGMQVSIEVPRKPPSPPEDLNYIKFCKKRKIPTNSGDSRIAYKELKNSINKAMTKSKGIRILKLN